MDVRARLGQKRCDSLAVAVIEPLESTVRARFGQKPCDNRLVAVIEPLEGTVRAVKGQKLFNQEHKCKE